MSKQMIIKDKCTWDKVIESFENSDIYFTYDYFRPFELNGDGLPHLYYYECSEGRVVYPFMLRDISDIECFSTVIEKNKYFDITSVYGYGGPLYNKKSENSKLEERFQCQFSKYCKEKNIISQFDRFNPLIENHELFKDYSEILSIRKTIHINLLDKDMIWKNIDSKCRNMIRKAQKNGVEIILEDDLKTINNFMDIYDITMKKNDASAYYYFNDEFFPSTIEELGKKVMIANAYYDGEIIASSLIMKYNKYIHYHFSGSKLEHRKLQANNLLLYKIAEWGNENEYEQFHLGGGYESNNDSLYKFKKSFSKLEDLDFYIGKKVHIKDSYNYLKNLRKELKNSNEKNDFFPEYRDR